MNLEKITRCTAENTKNVVLGTKGLLGAILSGVNLGLQDSGVDTSIISKKAAAVKYKAKAIWEIMKEKQSAE